MSDKLLFTTNQAGRVRTELVGGVEYLVAPVVAIKPGVLNGELVPAEEIAAYFPAWNGRPLVLAHPTDTDGSPVSANSPELLTRVQVGQLFNVGVREDGALRGELWVDRARAMLLGEDGKDLVRRLLDGKPVEVSTAYWRDLVPEAGALDGVEYYGVARNLRPDHLAMLLHEVGACSWQDGCGAPRVNQEATMQINVLSEARRPAYDGLNDGAWTAPTLEDYLAAYPGERPESDRVADLPAGAKRWIASHTLLGDAGADNFRDLSFFPVVGADGELYAAALRAVLGGRGSQANIPAGALESAQDMARSLLEREFTREERGQHNRLLNALRVIANALGLSGDVVGTEDGSNGDGEVQSSAPADDKNKTHQEVNVMDLRKQILEDGRLGLNEEQLNAMADETVEVLANSLATLQVAEAEPVAEEPPEPDDEPGEDEPEPAAEPQTNRQDPSPCADEVGALKAQLAEMRANVERLADQIQATNAEREAQAAARKAELVGQLATNEACAFGKEELEGLDLNVLEGLHRSLSPADYSGAGGGPQANRDEDSDVEVRMIVPLKKEA